MTMTPPASQVEEPDSAKATAADNAPKVDAENPRNNRSRPTTPGSSTPRPRSLSPFTPSRKPVKPTLADLPNEFVPYRRQDGASSSWSATSDNQLRSQASSSTTDRVFPVRSAIKVDTTQTPFGMPGSYPRTSNEIEYFPKPGSPIMDSRHASETSRRDSAIESLQQVLHQPGDKRRTEGISSGAGHSRDSGRYGGGSRMHLFSDASSEVSTEKTDSSSYRGTEAPNSIAGIRTPADDGEGSMSSHVTARFKHIVTSEGHAVITGRDGDTLQRCEDEPIHIPGAVQGFGLLIALEEQEEGRLVVKVVSENSQRMIGYTPRELFQMKSFCEILSEEQQDNLLDHVDFIRDEESDPATNGPEVFTISIRHPRSSRRSQKLWCAMHINPAHPGLVICEFELDDDQLYPLVPANEVTPEPPEDTLHSNPTEEEYIESTHAISKPLRVLRSARKRKGEAAAMEVFNIMSQVQEQLAAAQNLETFLKILVGVVKELTGFHRVMVYQFDSVFNGRVVTELVDPRSTKDLYKGLNFPASDIPKQARDMYKVNKVRLLYDRDLETARLVCRSVEDLEFPLDLSFSYLRAMSPIHIKYLTNMAVRSSMSISINAFNELWGLVSCHGYGSKGMRVSFPIRKMCRLVGDTASRNIEKLSYASRLQARKLINTVPTETNPSGYIIASSDDLLKLFDADSGLLSIRGETKILGKLEQSQEALAMLEYLRLRKITSVITSQDIRFDFPDLVYAPGFQVISGLLLVPLSVGGSDFIVFFRRGGVREVKWAGNPYEKFIKAGTEGYLEPRKSFKIWTENVVGKCREWTEEQVETAAVLCLVYGKFIEVWRQKEAALHSSQLTRLLLANSAHEVRTPLNAIINYLEIALEGSLDQETRENLSKSHSASKSLIYVINDLLDLTKTEEGQELIKDELFDLLATIYEATDSFKGEAKRKGLEYEVVEHPGIPRLVHGDQRRVRQVVSNIIVNAMQNTTHGLILVELWLQDLSGGRVTIEIVIEDTGIGMTDEKLDALFRDLEQVTTDEDDNLDEVEEPRQVTDGRESRTLGLGLAIVARTVRNMDGQLRLKSEEGKGSRFVVQLSFVLPDVDEAQLETIRDGESARASSYSSHAGVAPTPPPVSEGEVTLVEKGSSLRLEGISRMRSVEEMHSLHSFRSGSSGKSNRSNKSDVDRLIESLSTPLSVGEHESEETALQRSGSGHVRSTPGSLASASSARITGAHERPTGPRRAKSHGPPEDLPEHLRSLTAGGPAGAAYVKDSGTPLRAIRMPGAFPASRDDSSRAASKVLFKIPDENDGPKSVDRKPLGAEHLQILVAEDDPVNSRIIEKRLERSGHEVHHTINGEACASTYGEKTSFFDVVLMDMQMPIVDGLTSTKMIRSFERTHSGILSVRAFTNGRVPIFAVSASLVERERQTYIDAGFDGWILKPIDFKRLNTLIEGIVDDDIRKSCLYKPGEWERGGWFHPRESSMPDANTSASTKPPMQRDGESLNSKTSSESGSLTPKNTPKSNPRKQFVFDERREQTNNAKSGEGGGAKGDAVSSPSSEADDDVTEMPETLPDLGGC